MIILPDTNVWARSWMRDAEVRLNVYRSARHWYVRISWGDDTHSPHAYWVSLPLSALMWGIFHELTGGRFRRKNRA